MSQAKFFNSLVKRAIKLYTIPERKVVFANRDSNKLVVEGIHGSGKSTFCLALSRLIDEHNERVEESQRIHYKLVDENTDEIRRLAMMEKECYALFAITEMLVERCVDLPNVDENGNQLFYIIDRGNLPSTVYTALLEYIAASNEARMSSASEATILQSVSARVSYYITECTRRGFFPIGDASTLYITSTTEDFSVFEGWVKKRGRSNDIQLTSAQYKLLGNLYNHYHEEIESILPPTV